MKKSLLALAVLGAFAGAASAQSSVTLYGRVDLAVGKGSGTDAKSMGNGSGSRLGVRGVEDLGGGLQGIFNIEHRFEADTGAQSNTRFWTGRSIVGLQGGFGSIVLGREYTPAFTYGYLAADPWGWDTVVSGGYLDGTPGSTTDQGTSGLTAGGIGRVRNDSSATYKFSAAGLSFGAQVAEATDAPLLNSSGVNIGNNTPNKPWNVALAYNAGPISAAVTHERPGEEVSATAKWTTVSAAYNFGVVKVGGLFGKGNTATDVDRKSWMLTATAPIGAGELRAAYGQRKSDDFTLNDDNKDIKMIAVGYHYSLSKRTTVYADVVNNKGIVTTDRTGYDFGVKHNF